MQIGYKTQRNCSNGMLLLLVFTCKKENVVGERTYKNKIPHPLPFEKSLGFWSFQLQRWYWWISTRAETCRHFRLSKKKSDAVTADH